MFDFLCCCCCGPPCPPVLLLSLSCPPSLDETGAFGVCKASVHTGQFSITGPRTPVLKMLQEVAAPKDCTRLDVLPDMSFTLMGTEFSVTRNEYVVYVYVCRLCLVCRLLCTVHRSTRRWDHVTDHPHLFFFLLLLAIPIAIPIATNCHQFFPIATNTNSIGSFTVMPMHLVKRNV